MPGLAYDYFVMSSGVGNVYALSESLADGVVVRGLAVQRKVSMTGSVTSRSNAAEVKYVPALVSEASEDVEFESGWGQTGSTW